ncbi:MAG: peptidylprolyl isomerase [Armatimonadetes bacterium]|nr:peptidylprolyl isomerase [Armatimonadota bacterium]
MGAQQAVPNPRVLVTVEGRGTFTIELFPNEAPKTVAHFLGLVRRKFYDGVRFHRIENVPKPFIMEAGDPLTKTLPLNDARIGTGGSGKKVPFEKNSVRFLNGTVGLSRDVRDKDSGDSRFFICTGDQPFLDGKYVAFGRVVKGLALLPKIKLGDRITSIREVRG